MKTLKTLMNFLTMETKDAVGILVHNLVAKMKKATTTDAVLTNMVWAAVKVMREIGMTEEIRTLGLLVVCHYGDGGQEVPEAIAKLFPLAESKPAPVPTFVSAPARPSSE